ncbi:MAG: ATP-binding protein [Thermoanaerobaculia bacterium]|nr:ATP-binding protein [Thermoanaerobaculia bacterium]
MRRLAHEERLFWLAVAAGFPGSVTALAILWSGDYTAKVQWTLTVFIMIFWWGFAFSVRERTLLPLQTVANLLEAMREGDYSIRGRVPRPDDALGEVMVEVNQLGELLRSQRFERVDARSLLRQVLKEVDVAIFTFDEDQRLRLVNDAGERLMAQPAERLVGRSAGDLGLEACLEAEVTASLETSFPGQTGRWQVHHSVFREAGAPAHLLLLTDLSKALRDEERQAWQRLIRVLGHELNNSLAPIKSTATTLSSILRREDPHQGWREDAQRGLGMIADRCEALNRFVVAYSKLARLPAPQLRPVALSPLVRRVASMENRRPVHVEPGPDAMLRADGDQLEQLLINLVKNAAEAAEETSGDVTVTWRTAGDSAGEPSGGVVVQVIDTGPGLLNTSNLFVPFFTTKPGGSGIGLVLCRQIAEAHGGSLELVNRDDGVSGCVASLRLSGQL